MTPSYHLTGQAAVVTGAFAGMGMAAHADRRDGRAADIRFSVVLT